MFEGGPTIYVPRDEVGLRRCDGETVALEPLPDVLRQPIRIYKSGNIKGLASGYRSALLFANGKMYRIKGVRPHRRYRGKDLSDPLGGQYLSRAMMEIENMLKIAEVFEKEGLPYPCRPVGYTKYPIQFNGEQLAASIFEVHGDTRVDEFLAWLEEDIREERKVNLELCDKFNVIGTKMGRLKRIMDNNGYSWYEDNAHTGNFVVFEREGYIHLGIVDLDLTERLGEESKELQSHENARLLYDIISMTVSSRTNRILRLSRRTKSLRTHPTPCRLALEIGFSTGYEHSTDLPLRADTIYEAKRRASKNLEDAERGIVLTYPLGSDKEPKSGKIFALFGKSGVRVAKLTELKVENFTKQLSDIRHTTEDSYIQN